MFKKTIVLAAIGVLCSLILPKMQTAQADEPLKLTPQNTVILDGSTYAGFYLQRYLIQYYVGAKEADEYGAPNHDLAASPYFSLVREGAKIAADKNIIAVGQTKYLTDADKARLAAAPNGATLIKREGNVVVVAGAPIENPWMGNFTAMGDFLNQVCGIRFYAPYDLWVSRPKSTFINVGDLNYFQAKAFATSYFAPYYAPAAEWMRVNTTTGDLTINVNHNLGNIFPPEKYAKTNPDIYELRNGNRLIPQVGSTAWQPSLVAPELPELTMDYIRERMKGTPNLKYISLGMMDMDFHDESPEAVASVKKYGDYSQLYFTYVNNVAKLVEKEYPKLYVTAYIYSNVRRAPVGIHFEPNVAIGFVTKLYSFIDPKNLATQEKQIQQFTDLGAKFFIHDWNFGGVSPRLYSRVNANFLKWGQEHGMLGAYVEWSPGEHWYIDGAKYWILAQLLANPDQDTDAMWKTYCDDMYGPASGDMYKLFMHFQDVYAHALPLISPADLPRQMPAAFTPKDLAYERGLLQDAVSKTKNDADIQARLAAVMRQFRGHELFAEATYEPNRLDVIWKGEGINKPLLAFYLNDDGSTMTEAISYYNTKFTVPPDSNFMSKGLGLLPSIINNYTRGYNDVLQQIRAVATTKVDKNVIGQARVSALNNAAKKIVLENLPTKYDPAQLKKLDGVLDKSILVPTVSQMPIIDGDLSDAVWKQAAPLEDWTVKGTLGIPTDETEGKIMRVGDKLVLGLTAHQAGNIFADTQPQTTTGTRIWHESCYEIFLSTLPKSGEDVSDTPYAQYIVNALGAFRGFGLASDNRDGVEAAAKLDQATHTFTVEIAIPLNAAGYDFTGNRALLFNIVRDVNSSSKQDLDTVMGWYPVMSNANADSRTSIYFDGN
ncbi:MAG: DUF4838 domain-containing protein [Abditibacteriaceae bacterium]